MKRRVFGVAAAATACFALAATSSVAIAGNPHGTPPGQEKKQDASASATASASQSSSEAQSSSPATSSESQSSSTTTTSADSSTGVKPSNTTQHDTYAPASSNTTKLYGNGKTAGQIATQAGYGSSTLHGPGNSQPHKVLCGPHEVDVHALKAKGNKCGTPTSSSCGTSSCTSTTTTTSTSTSTTSNTSSNTTVTTSSNTATSSTTSSSPSSSTGATAGAASGTAGVTASSTTPTTSSSAVLGARATVKTPTSSAAPQSGVLGAIARTGTLPFTGLPLWVPALAGLGLLGTGLALRRRAGSQI